MTSPRTYLVGYTQMNMSGVRAYLEDVGASEFLNDIDVALDAGITGGEILCSLYAKLCYKSLVGGRSVKDNLEGCFDMGHGSVFEHCYLNFLTTGCSRVFTHELVRHRVGTSFSQTSGRYVEAGSGEFVVPPELDNPACRAILEGERDRVVEVVQKLKENMVEDNKRTRSAIRRVIGSGMENEIGWGVNIRSLRHVIKMRTSEAAEWEIRKVFADVAELVNDRFGLMLYGMKKREGHYGLAVWE